jgi:hypothetical protein
MNAIPKTGTDIALYYVRSVRDSLNAAIAALDAEVRG